MDGGNHETARAILAEVKNGLSAYVVESYKDHYTESRFLAELKNVSVKLKKMNSNSKESAIKNIDSQGCLSAIVFRKFIFKDKLGHEVETDDLNVLNGLNFAGELLNARNARQAHDDSPDSFSDEDLLSLADAATRLLNAIDAKKEAAITASIKQNVGRNIFYSGTEVVDLSGLDLSKSDLRYRNLQSANLQGACLIKSDLRDAELQNMNLRNVKLSKSNLKFASLRKADLNNADLTQARLENAYLGYANFSCAILERAILRDADITRVNFSYANLTSVDFSNSKEKYGDFIDGLNDPHDYGEIIRFGTNFDFATLRRANMQRTYFDSASLIKADLTEADFTGARVSDSDFSGAILNYAIFSNCEILSCNFSSASMIGIDLSEVRYSVHSIFTNADMSDANLENFYIDPYNFGEEHHWDNVNLSGANLSGAMIQKQSFRNANLTGAIFKDADLSHSDLSNTDLMDTDFTFAKLEGVNFTGAKFRFSTILPDGSYWNEDTNMTQFTG